MNHAQLIHLNITKVYRYKQLKLNATISGLSV